jgi:hypothetical protein
MNKRIQELAEQAGYKPLPGFDFANSLEETYLKKYTELVVRECIEKIETYRIPVGNSAAGEMACEWTYDALKEIRDEIKECFGIDQ